MTDLIGRGKSEQHTNVKEGVRSEEQPSVEGDLGEGDFPEG